MDYTNESKDNTTELSVLNGADHSRFKNNFVYQLIFNNPKTYLVLD